MERLLRERPPEEPPEGLKEACQRIIEAEAAGEAALPWDRRLARARRSILLSRALAWAAVGVMIAGAIVGVAKAGMPGSAGGKDVTASMGPPEEISRPAHGQPSAAAEPEEELDSTYQAIANTLRSVKATVRGDVPGGWRIVRFVLAPLVGIILFSPVWGPLLAGAWWMKRH